MKIRQLFPRNFVLIILLFLAIPLIYFVIKKPNIHSHNEEIKLVEAEDAELQNIKSTANFIGVIKSEQVTNLVAKVNGVIDLQVKAGDKVTPHQLVAKIINSEVEKNYLLAQEAAKIADNQFTRTSKLLNLGVVSKNILEDKKQHWLEAQTRLSNAKIALEELNIYAPFVGIVGILKIHTGAQVRANDPIVTMYDSTKLFIEFGIPLAIAKKVKDGNEVLIDNQPLKLTHVQKILDHDSGMCPAYVHYDCPECIIGSNINLELVVEEKNSVIVIPSTAMFLQDGQNYVYVIKDFTTILTLVKTGIIAKDKIEIISGLAAGDTIIIKVTELLQPDQKVKIFNKN